MKTSIHLEAEDKIWAEWERASAKAQNDYYRTLTAAHDSFEAGGDYSALEAAVNQALASRNAADEAAIAAYRAAMKKVREPHETYH